MTARPDSHSPSCPGNSSEFLHLVDELERYGLLDDPALGAALQAFGLDPGDNEARGFIEDTLAPYRFGDAAAPNPFLPVPRPGEVDGPFRFASVDGQDDNRVGFTPSELALGGVICGEAGHGKTVSIVDLLVSIIEAGQDVLFWAFTKKDDLAGLAKLSPGRVNVFQESVPYNGLDFMGTTIRTHPGTVARLLLHGDDVLPGTVDFLADAITALYKEHGIFDGSEKYPVWGEVHSRISRIKPVDNMTKYYKTVITAKLRALLESFSGALNFRKGLDLRHTVGKNTVFKLGQMMPPSIRRFRLLSILTWLFSYRQLFSFEQLSGLPLIVCVIDDAAEVFDARLEKRGDLPPIFDLVTMARQYRIAFVCSTQIPELLGRAIWDNHGSTICFRLPGLESRKKVGEVLG